VVIFHKIPKPQITYGNKASKDKPRAGSFDGEGGPGVHDGKGGMLDSVVNFFATPFTSSSASSPVMSSNGTTPATPVVGDRSNLTLSTAQIPTPVPTPVIAGNNPAPAPITKPVTSTFSAPVTQSPASYSKLTVSPTAPSGTSVPNTLPASSPIPSQFQTYTPAAGVLSPIKTSSTTPVTQVADPGVTLRPTSSIQPLPTYPGIKQALSPSNLWDGLKDTISGVSKVVSPVADVVSGYAGAAMSLPFTASAPYEALLRNIPKYWGGYNDPSELTQKGDTWSGKIARSLTSESPWMKDLLKYDAPGSENSSNSTSITPKTGEITSASDGKIIQPAGGNVEKPGVSTQVTADGGVNPAKYNNGLSSSNLGSSGAGSAAINYASALGVADLNMPLAKVIEEKGLDTVINAIIGNEGSSIPGVLNNPGNIKFNNLPGQTNSGITNDGGKSYFASYATPEEGRKAIADIVLRAAAGKSDYYGPNPTLQSFANTYTDTSAGSSGSSFASSSTGPKKYPNLSGISPEAMTALQNEEGPGRFVEAQLGSKSDVFGGKTLAQVQDENKKGIMDEYKITEKRDLVEKLQKEQLDLPDTVTEFIKQRDTYINETDRAIEDYIKEMSTMTMSDPATAQRASEHLNYLYTLRGRQNQTYVGYLNQTVKEHQAALDTATTDANKAITLANEALTSKNAMTEEQYKLHSTSLSDLYTSLLDAENRQLQTDYLRTQATGANGTTAVDMAKKYAASGYVAEANKLEGYVWDKDHRAIPGTDLIDVIKTLSDPMGGGLDNFNPSNVYKAYVEGVRNYLTTAPVKSADAKAGDVTSSSQLKMGEDAIHQFANVANYGIGVGDAIAVEMGANNAYQVADLLSKHVSGTSLSIAPAIMTAVETLAPHGIFGGAKETPSLADFIQTVKDKTGNDPMSDSIAKATYSAFLRFKADNGTADTAVQAMTMTGVDGSTNSTQNRDNLRAKTPEEFAKTIGEIYALDVLWSEFGIDQTMAIALQKVLST
jgi:hypothetical protein